MTEKDIIIKNDANFIESEKTESIMFTNHLDTTAELKFFLQEYKQFQSEKFDYFYIITTEWFKKWDYFMLNPCKENYPPKIDNQLLIDENKIIKQNLIENLDFIILPKKIAYYFHDTYRGNKRLKTKFRHIYNECLEFENKSCNYRHDIKTVFKVFELERILEEDNEINDTIKKNDNDKCHYFSWC